MHENIALFTKNYSISPDGVVKNKNTGRVLKGSVCKTTGYRRIYIKVNGMRVVYAAHVLLASIYIPNPNKFSEVNHIDGNKLNNSIDNLEWCTSFHNVRHAFTTGLTKQKPIIDYSLVSDTLNSFLKGVSLRDLAHSLGITETSTLRKLLKREAIREGKENLFNIAANSARRTLIQRSSSPVLRICDLGLRTRFKSINEAARNHGCSPASIYKAIVSGKMYKGYVWRKEC